MNQSTLTKTYSSALMPSPLKSNTQSDSSGPNTNVDTQTLEIQWRHVQSRLRTELGEDLYNNWVKPLSLMGADDDRISLAAPTRFVRDHVRTHHGLRIEEIWREMDSSWGSVDIVLNLDASISNAPQAVNVQTDRAAEQSTLGSALEPRFTFESFVLGKSNELAYHAAIRVAEADSVQFNPLYLYGGVGLGKTHLMHAIAQHIRLNRPERKVMYLSAEKFMFQFIRALRYKDTMAFKEQFRSVDVLMIDDVQFISGKDSTQEEFFHTFNALVDQKRQIILSGDRSPSDLEGMEERLRSRLGWGLVADIHPTDYELRLGILQNKVEQGRDSIPEKVLEFLAERITSNVRELEGALNRVLAYSSLVGRPISMEMASEVLQDLLRANDRKVTIDDIKRCVAEYYNVKMTEMDSARRARAIARPRQIAMYMCKQLTSRSLPEIGRKFGGRDHTTVMHALKKVEELRQTDSSLAEDLDLIKRKLNG